MNSKELGKIIFLNGASSSGKSTLARSLQARLPEPFIHFSFDHLRDSHAIPTERFQRGDFDWPTHRPLVFDGFHRCLEAFASAGNNLIVEHIIEQRKWLIDLVKSLSPFDVFFVGLHCPLEQLNEREKARKNRSAGEAESDFAIVHSFSSYDLEIDTTRNNTLNTDLLMEKWSNRKKPSQFDILMKTIKSENFLQ